MRIDELKQEIIDYSKEIGIDKIGFASADVFSELTRKIAPTARVELSIRI